MDGPIFEIFSLIDPKMQQTGRRPYLGKGFVYSETETNDLKHHKYSLTRCPRQQDVRSPIRPRFFFACPSTPGSENDCGNCKVQMHFDPLQAPEAEDKGETSDEEGLATGETITDQSEEESEDAPEQPKKFHFTPRKKMMVVRAIQYARDKFDQTGPNLSEQVYEEVETMTGAGRTTIWRYWKQSMQGALTEMPPAKHKGHSGRKRIIIDNFLQDSIRRRIFNFYTNKEWPRLRTVFASFEEEMEQNIFPKMGFTTFYKMVRAIGFEYVKRNDKRFLYERTDITAMRHRYLRKIRQLRREGYIIHYQDETWCNAHHTQPKCWLFVQDKKSLLPSYHGEGGLKVPSGAGQRIIINHAGGPGGFLPVADVFIGKTDSADYHTQMNTKNWMEWFETRLLPALPDHSVIVVDNAKYHNQITEETRRPTTAWRKQELRDWLTKHDIAWENNEIKPELLQKARATQTEPVYVTDEMAKNSGKDIVVLRLPIGHCELNPIELIWAQVKRAIADENKTFRIKDVKDLAVEALKDVTDSDWQKTIDHVLKVEEEYWKKDHLFDIEINPVFIEDDLDEEEDDEYAEEPTEDILFVDNGLEPTNS